MNNITIVGATENNLKDVSLEIPKGRITVFTGVSGSGKSSLCLDTIAAESRRELNETFPSFVQQYLPKYGRPHVERIENMPVTIVIDQKKPANNSRSTVGTYTDIYALLRLLFSRIGEPFVGYSDTFSFNHPSGMCPRCSGLGVVTDLDIHKLVDFDKCLNDEDVIHFPTFTTGAWRWKRYAYSGLFDLNKKIKDYTPEELNLLLYSPQVRLKNPPSNWPKSAKFEGLYPRMYRSIITTKEGKRQQKVLDGMTCTTECPECHGTRLNERVRSCRIRGKNLADVVAMPITEALAFVDTIDHPLATDLRGELHKRLQALCDIGLGYLSLSRGTGTLSGGEAQRIKIAKYINSPLTDMAYVLDEPSVGLHPQDISRLKTSLRHLRDHGNTVLIVEHHREIIAMADHLVDMGPGAGDHGGKITFEGGYDGLLASDTVTGRMLRDRTPLKQNYRKPSGWYHIKDATLHNLKHIDVEIPQGVITVIAGVAGSGKSSLMEFFMQQESSPLVFIGQKDIGINLRSTPATYLDISDTIRRLFAKEGLVDGQHPAHTSVQLFSFNSKGACPACGGKGVIVSDMAFMESIETVCEECHGSRYNHEALQYRYRGKTIAEVMDLTVEEAIEFFCGMTFLPQLQMLEKVGLGYLHLNQSMSTLSGGELQRVKLADRLYSTAIHLSATETRLSGGHTYIIDEPTDGLHLDDVRRLLELFDEMVDAGNTLILIEHSLDVMKRADYMIELGPGGGDNGGQLLFCGTPDAVLHAPHSVTAQYLKASLPFDR
jgi:excinuclease UvrABC ATPase subunit